MLYYGTGHLRENILKACSVSKLGSFGTLQSHIRASTGNPNTISAIFVCILASVTFGLERPYS